MAKKHILKPGKHQFAPGSFAVHDNDSLTDKEAEWYLERYPHIVALFETGNNTEEGPDEISEAEVAQIPEIKFPFENSLPNQ